MRIFLFIVLFHLTANGQSDSYRKMLSNYYTDFPTISCNDAANMVGKDNVYFLDTREQKEFDVSHIRTAQCVGFDNFKMSSVNEIPKDGTIVVYCSIGARSQDIGEKLKKAGYTDVRNLYGGIFHWNNSGYRMVNNAGERTSKIHGFSKEWGKWITRGKVIY